MVRTTGARLTMAALAILFAGAGAPSHAASCAVPLSSGEKPRTSDCLYVLRSAVELEDCELCLCDVDGSSAVLASDAHLCLRTAVGLQTSLACPPCATTTTIVEETTTTTLAQTTTTLAPTTTTTTILAPNLACPGAVEWTTEGRFGASCETNADCEAGECEETSGRCRTASRLDMGWGGLAHGIDPGDGASTRMKVACDSETAPCGECEVRGIDPSSGHCRCANDTRAICDEPFAADADDCASCTGGERNKAPCDSDEDCPGGACSGAALCECFDGPPLPVSAGGTPLCVLPRFGAQPDGTADVDAGESAVSLAMRAGIYLGIGTRTPCPVCGGTCSNNASSFCVRDDDCAGGTCNGDSVANDGERGGVCGPLFGDYTGPDKGQPCDNQSFQPSYPAHPSPPNGGWYSLDCMPDVGKNVGGQGLLLHFTRTTGTSSLSSQRPCLAPYASLDCPCLVCSADPAVACNTDEDCAGLRSPCQLATGGNAARCDHVADCASASGGTCNQNVKKCSAATSFACTTNADCANLNLGACPPPTCSSRGIGEYPQPNGCENSQCTDTGSNVGTCTTGPSSKFCSEVVEADGSGVLSCASNDDCSLGVIGVAGAGNCTLEEKLGCFLDPIEANGNPDPQHPLLAEAFCMPPTSGAGKNTAIGLPGPARALRQTKLRSWCDAEPGKPYTPGSGGCEP